MSRRFVVDARMMFSSGIGRVIRNILCRLELTGHSREAIVGHVEMADWLRKNARHFEPRVVNAPIYGLREQMAIPPWSRNAALWVPHFNIPFLHKGPLLVTVHDMLHLARPDLYPGKIRRGVARAYFEGIRQKATRVICVSDFTRREMLRFVKSVENRCRVILNGVDPEWNESLDGTVPEDGKYFLMIGNMKRNKNFRIVMDAFGKAKVRFPHSLIVVGQREGFRSSDPTVLRVADDGRIHFTGWVEEVELRRLLKRATALVFPSLYEGFGLPPLEAMVAGVPVLATNASSVPEVCGNAVRYFDPCSESEIEHALIWMAGRSEAERKNMEYAGRQQAAKFRWDETARSYELEILSLLKN